MKNIHFIFMLMPIGCISLTHAYSLPKQPIKSYECSECSSLSHEQIEDKWSISEQPLNNNISNKQKSYSYRKQITAKQLKKGVAISILAPGAVIRITPLQKKSMPQSILKTPTNQSITLEEASRLFSQDDGISSEDPFTIKYQTSLQIKPELGAGTFILKSSFVDEKSTDTYLINVFDKFSSTYLEVESDSFHYKYGDKLTATFTLKDNENECSIDDIEASLISPQGTAIPLQLIKVKPNQFQATTILNSEINFPGVNWYIEANLNTILGGKIIRRNGHAAFSYAIPSATLLSVDKISSKPLTFIAALDVGTASRYALQSVLFHQNGKDAVIKPIEISQKAQWFEPGTHIIQFTFDNLNQLSEDSLYLGYLHLIDYGQLRTVYDYNKPIKVNQLLE